MKKTYTRRDTPIVRTAAAGGDPRSAKSHGTHPPPVEDGIAEQNEDELDRSSESCSPPVAADADLSDNRKEPPPQSRRRGGEDGDPNPIEQTSLSRSVPDSSQPQPPPPPVNWQPLLAPEPVTSPPTASTHEQLQQQQQQRTGEHDGAFAARRCHGDVSSLTGDASRRAPAGFCRSEGEERDTEPAKSQARTLATSAETEPRPQPSDRSLDAMTTVFEHSAKPPPAAAANEGTTPTTAARPVASSCRLQAQQQQQKEFEAFGESSSSEFNENASREKKFNVTTAPRDLVRRPPRRLTGLDGSSMSALVKSTGSEVDEQLNEFDYVDDGKGKLMSKSLCDINQLTMMSSLTTATDGQVRRQSHEHHHHSHITPSSESTSVGDDLVDVPPNVGHLPRRSQSESSAAKLQAAVADAVTSSTALKEGGGGQGRCRALPRRDTPRVADMNAARKQLGFKEKMAAKATVSETLVEDNDDDEEEEECLQTPVDVDDNAKLEAESIVNHAITAETDEETSGHRTAMFTKTKDDDVSGHHVTSSADEAASKSTQLVSSCQSPSSSACSAKASGTHTPNVKAPLRRKNTPAVLPKVEQLYGPKGAIMTSFNMLCEDDEEYDSERHVTPVA